MLDDGEGDDNVYIYIYIKKTDRPGFLPPGKTGYRFRSTIPRNFVPFYFPNFDGVQVEALSWKSKEKEEGLTREKKTEETQKRRKWREAKKKTKPAKKPMARSSFSCRSSCTATRGGTKA